MTSLNNKSYLIGHTQRFTREKKNRRTNKMFVLFSKRPKKKKKKIGVSQPIHKVIKINFNKI